MNGKCEWFIRQLDFNNLSGLSLRKNGGIFSLRSAWKQPGGRAPVVCAQSRPTWQREKKERKKKGSKANEIIESAVKIIERKRASRCLPGRRGIQSRGTPAKNRDNGAHHEKGRKRVFLLPSFVPCCPYLNPGHGGSRSYATGHSVDTDVCIRSHELRSGVYAPNHAAAYPVDLLSGASESVIPVVAQVNVFCLRKRTTAGVAGICQIAESSTLTLIFTKVNSMIKWSLPVLSNTFH